jgi:hypothetical protein
MEKLPLKKFAVSLVSYLSWYAKPQLKNNFKIISELLIVKLQKSLCKLK